MNAMTCNEKSLDEIFAEVKKTEARLAQKCATCQRCGSRYNRHNHKRRRRHEEGHCKPGLRFVNKPAA